MVHNSCHDVSQAELSFGGKALLQLLLIYSGVRALWCFEILQDAEYSKI